MAGNEDDLEAMLTMSLDQLRSAWRERYGAPPPLRSEDLLARLLAFRMQADERGGLSTETLALLRRKERRKADGLELGEGAVITKLFRGRSYEVTVLRNGFQLEGVRYRSLSEAATALTGTKRNGPRFFGLRRDREGAA